MATVREPARAPADASPPLITAAGEPVSVVHVTAEYFPYARTGGLAEAVSGLFADPDRRRALGEAARRRIETEFPIERMVGDYEQALAEVLGGGG